MHFKPITWPSEMKQEKPHTVCAFYVNGFELSDSSGTRLHNTSIAMTNISLAIWTKSPTCH